LLLLDEPTNHLDLETREALTMALAQFEGTLVLVSHDRHLLRATTDQFLIVADGRLQPFDGDLDDYKEWLFQTKLGKPVEAAPVAKDGKPAAAPVPAVDRREQKRLEAEERQRLAALKKPIESRIKRLEEQMAKLNAKKSDIDARLLEPSIYEADKKEELKNLVADQAFCSRDLEQLEGEWLELQEQLEGLMA
jgi:ATP-binding cassette subfamily F protein 3